MKKNIVVLLLALVSGLSAMNNGQWSAASLRMLGHQAFGKDWLFKKPVTMKDSESWNNELVKAFSIVDGCIKKHGKKVKYLELYRKNVRKASIDFFNTVTITYQNLFSPTIASNLNSQQILERKIALRPSFDEIVKNMADVKVKIAGQMRKSKKKDIINAYMVLDGIAQVVMDLAKMASKSIDFLPVGSQR